MSLKRRRKKARVIAVVKLNALRQRIASAEKALYGLQNRIEEAAVAEQDGDMHLLHREVSRLRALNVEVLGQVDIATERAHALSRQAETDSVTGIANRGFILAQLRQETALADHNGRKFGLLFVDLDNFKSINDKLGHHVGDATLAIVAARLLSAVRSVDTVARYGGDEFLVLLPGLGNRDDVSHIADKVVSAVGLPCAVGGHQLILSASVGVSLFPDDGSNLEDLIRLADKAMYRAKSSGGGCVSD